MAQIENTCERREAQRASYGFPANELNEADRYLLHGGWREACVSAAGSDSAVNQPGRVYIDAEVIPVLDQLSPKAPEGAVADYSAVASLGGHLDVFRTHPAVGA
jgi:hypothetical protein